MPIRDGARGGTATPSSTRYFFTARQSTVAVQRRQQGGILVLPGGAVVGIHISGGDKDEAVAAIGECGHRTPNLTGLAGDVDDDVPFLRADLIVGIGLVSVGRHEDRALGQWTGLTTAKAADVMPQFQGGRSDVAAEPGRPAEDQESHPASTTKPAPKRNAVRRRHNPPTAL